MPNIGLLQIITYFVCLHLVFKAIQIFQIALMSSRPDRWLGLVLGIGAVAASVYVSFQFVWLMDEFAPFLLSIFRGPPQ